MARLTPTGNTHIIHEHLLFYYTQIKLRRKEYLQDSTASSSGTGGPATHRLLPHAAPASLARAALPCALAGRPTVVCKPRKKYSEQRESKRDWDRRRGANPVDPFAMGTIESIRKWSYEPFLYHLFAMDKIVLQHHLRTFTRQHFYLTTRLCRARPVPYIYSFFKSRSYNSICP
jgi:hypothetical protein